MNLDEIKSKNKSYSKEQVNFVDYCLRRMDERQITKEDIFKFLFGNNLLKSEIQEIPYRGETETRHKLTYKFSSKYYLIIIISYEERVLNVINVIKTSKNLEKKWRKRISR
ncbi:MAG: hypothetical protein Q8P57_04015 [Candidatus Pacearchaeota archaeon]|nr:hypothetical protein [Candidatus Pacearchaeota archaeon]